MPAIREAVVDGLFYPAAPAALRRQVVDYLDGAGIAGEVSRPPKLLITPHADVSGWTPENTQAPHPAPMTCRALADAAEKKFDEELAKQRAAR